MLGVHFSFICCTFRTSIFLHLHVPGILRKTNIVVCICIFCILQKHLCIFRSFFSFALLTVWRLIWHHDSASTHAFVDAQCWDIWTSDAKLSFASLSTVYHSPVVKIQVRLSDLTPASSRDDSSSSNARRSPASVGP